MNFPKSHFPFRPKPHKGASIDTSATNTKISANTSDAQSIQHSDPIKYTAHGDNSHRKSFETLAQGPEYYMNEVAGDDIESQSPSTLYMSKHPEIPREGATDTSDQCASAPVIRHGLKPDKWSIDSTSVFEIVQRELADSYDYSFGYLLEDFIFYVDWDVEGFISEELEGNRDLRSTLTLSGTVQRAYATACEDYIQQFWPEYDKHALEHLFAILLNTRDQDEVYSFKSSPHFRGLLGLEVHTSLESKSRLGVIVNARTEVQNLISFAQILAWITANFRRPKQGQLSYSTPIFEKIFDYEYSIKLSELEPISDELCWTPMFTNGVIAKGFPVPERGNEIGLEISFNLMVTLGRIWYPMEYLDGFVLKGYSTILVPTLYTGESVQWHFINNKDPNTKIGMGEIESSCASVVENVSFEMLQKARTFVGWTTKAIVHAGAKTSGYEYVRDSEVPPAPCRPRLAREMTPSFGTAGAGMFGSMFSPKVLLPKALSVQVENEHRLIEDKLLNARHHSLLLWDAGTMRGWMVSELSAILIILQVWAARQTDCDALLEKIPFVEPTSNDAEASYQAILLHRQLLLRSRKGAHEEDLTFMTQIKNTFAALESRREQIITRERDSISVEFSTSTYLKGWELTQIAYSEDWPEEKRLRLESTSDSWPTLLKKRPKVLVLFCQGIGDLITPSNNDPFCQTWKSVPKYTSYLAATAQSIQNVGLYCRETDKKLDACRLDGKDCSSPLQKLGNEPASPPFLVPIEGAIIVGKLHWRLYQRCLPVQLKDKDHRNGVRDGETNKLKGKRKECSGHTWQWR